MDGAAELPAGVPGREQGIPASLCGDVRMGLQRRAGDAELPASPLGPEEHRPDERVPPLPPPTPDTNTRSHPRRSTSRPSKTPNSWPREVESPEAILRNGRSRAILGAARAAPRGRHEGIADSRQAHHVWNLQESLLIRRRDARRTSILRGLADAPGRGRRGALRRGLRPGRGVGGALGGDRAHPGVAGAGAGARRSPASPAAMVAGRGAAGLLPEDGAAGGAGRPSTAASGSCSGSTPGRPRRRSPVVLEVQFLAAGRRAWWWRKVELDRPGWREVDLPLDYFRPGGGVPAWEEVDRLGFFFRTGATLGLDGIELRRGRAPDAAYLSTSELVREAFGAGARPRPPPRAVRRRDRRAPARRGEAARRPGGHVRAGPGPTCRPCRPPPARPRS